MLEDLLSAAEEWRADRERAKRQANLERDARIEELTVESRTNLSRLMHEAHAGGVPKHEVNRIVGVYSNSYLSRPLWEAFTPDTRVDLRGKSRSVPTPVNNTHVTDNGDGTFSVAVDSGRTWTVVSPALFEENGEYGVEFESPAPLDIDNDDEYAQVYKRILDYLRERSNNG